MVIQNEINKHVIDKLNDSKCKWDWNGLSQNPIITFDIVESNPDKPWDWRFLSRNPNITFDIVKANPDKPWVLGYLSRNPNITWDIVQTNPDKPWDWWWLSMNPNITWDIAFVGSLILRNVVAKATMYKPIRQNLGIGGG